MMKKSIIAAGLAATLAATSFAGSAMARPGWNHGHPRYHHGGGDVGPAIVGGAIAGMLGAAIVNSQGRYDRPYRGYGYDRGPRSHTAWCEWRYRTYNPATDMYYARPGVRAYCHSPYD